MAGHFHRRYVKRILEDNSVAIPNNSASFTINGSSGKASRFYLTPKAEGVKTTSGGKPRPAREVIQTLKTKGERRKFRKALTALGRHDLALQTLE